MVAVYVRNSPSKNLLHSTLLELFDFIRQENLKKLIAYLFEKHGDFFEKHAKVFHKLRARYEQNTELTRKAHAGLEPKGINKPDEKKEEEEAEKQLLDEDAEIEEFNKRALLRKQRSSTEDDQRRMLELFGSIK